MALSVVCAATSLPRLLSLPPRNPKYALVSSSSHLSPTQYSSILLSKRWSTFNGSIHLGVSLKLKRLGKRTRRMGSKYGAVYASLFGVGAPEALVIGVVALLVFGPKGLAEVARNLGKTLRAFQPTIRELQDVSREFKSTLEREIGLDDPTLPGNYKPTPTYMNDSIKASVDKNGPPAAGEPYSSEDLLAITEEQLKTSSVPASGKQTEPSTSLNVSEAPYETTAQVKKPEDEKLV